MDKNSPTVEWVVRRSGVFSYNWRWRPAGGPIWFDGGEAYTKRGAVSKLQRSLDRHMNGGRRPRGKVILSGGGK